jgi:hypothetical protein
MGTFAAQSKRETSAAGIEFMDATPQATMILLFTKPLVELLLFLDYSIQRRKETLPT